MVKKVQWNRVMVRPTGSSEENTGVSIAVKDLLPNDIVLYGPVKSYLFNLFTYMPDMFIWDVYSKRIHRGGKVACSPSSYSSRSMLKDCCLEITHTGLGSKFPLLCFWPQLLSNKCGGGRFDDIKTFSLLIRMVKRSLSPKCYSWRRLSSVSGCKRKDQQKCRVYLNPNMRYAACCWKVFKTMSPKYVMCDSMRELMETVSQ